ncbi:hypothetical protein PanWU01x14_184130, partial [Parasponia andersonii]
VELPELDNIRFQWDDVELAEVNNIDELIHESNVEMQDDFLVDDDEFEDDKLEAYDDEEIEIFDSDTSSEENNNISDDEITFDYPQENVIFMDSIGQSMMHYLRDWRNNIKVHFIAVSGMEALATVKAKPYKNVPEDH